MSIFSSKTATRIWLFVLFLFVIVGAGLVYLVSSLPNYDGIQSVNGLTAEATIVRDKDTVVHITAASQKDAAFALGYAHAQDRLWQLELNRRIGQGRLSEIFGEEAVKTDKFMRTMGFYRSAQSAEKSLDSEARAVLTSYAAGINAYVKNRSGAMPPEFIIFKLKFAPWQLADSLVWGKLMSLDLSYQWRTELARFALSSQLSQAQLSELMPAYPGDATVKLPSPADLYPGLLPPQIKVDETEGKGSNNWVVSGTRTKSGKPLLANDPHLSLSAPGIWYLVHVRMGDKNVVGVSMPSLPFIVLGRTDNLAWGFTNTAPDSQDIIIEKITNPALGEYQTPTGTDKLVSRSEIIKVKGAEDINLTVRESRNGPILSDAIDGLVPRLGTRYVMAMRWTALADGDTSIAAGIGLNRAQNVREAITAMRGYLTPQQNIVLADTNGDIAYIAAGKVPQRSSDNITQGLMPSPGWLKSSEWTSYIPYEKLPQTINPKSGYVATANQKIVGDDYPFIITRDWEDPYRHDRIEALLLATPKHDVLSFEKIQADILSEPHMKMRDALVATLSAQKNPKSDIIEALKKWDGRMSAEASIPLIISSWHRHFVERVTQDDLGLLFKDFWRSRTRFVLGVLAENPSSAAWCDVKGTQDIESCAQEIMAAYDDAIMELTAEYGPNWKSWTWGAAHSAVAEHRPFSNVSQLEPYFNIRRVVGGSSTTINVAHPSWGGKRPYDANLIASYRGIFDLSDLENSRYVMPNGQSGNPLSDHYKDFATRWSQVKYIKIPTKDADIAKLAEHTLTLSPQ
jgi:penicillin G amidase